MAAAVMAAGCGSTTKTAPHTTATAASTSTASASTPSTAASTDCNTLGIDPKQMHEGTCTHAGVTYVIMDENHTLKLHTLSATLSGIHTASAEQGTSAQGKFVVASISVTNHLELPQTFDAGGTQQAGLILEGTVYKEDTGAELSDLASCAHKRTRIASGKSETCDVIFDVPARSAADIGQHGSGDLYIVDFGSDLAGSISPQTVGQIRLYH
jgi:hypothetical protein